MNQFEDFFCIFVARIDFMNLLNLIYILLATLFIVLSVWTACVVVCHEVAVKIPSFTGIAYFFRPDDKLYGQERNLLTSDIMRNNRANGPPALFTNFLWHRQQ